MDSQPPGVAEALAELRAQLETARDEAAKDTRPDRVRFQIKGAEVELGLVTREVDGRQTFVVAPGVEATHHVRVSFDVRGRNGSLIEASDEEGMGF